MITDEAGGVIARLSYDAFGNRRNAATWSGAPTAGEWSAVAAVTHRGFTFHEHLDHLETIHMNGRVFDPRLGRFLSADPFVQSPDFSQSFNRYSYTFNNPLSYTDPSGYIGGPASGHPDEGPPAVAPEVRPFPSLFPDWNRGELTSRRFGGLGNGLMRMVCNRNPDACDRILRPYHRMHNFSGSTAGGLLMLADTLTSASGLSYLRNEQPSALAELRRNHPALRQLEDELWQASLPSSFGLFLQKAGFPEWSGAREHAALVFQSTTNSDRLTFRQYAASPDTPNAINGDLTAPAGFRLIAIFHTHPFTYRTGNTRGPSPADFATANGSPSVLHCIRALGPVTGPYPGEWYYYGPSAVTP